MRPMGGLGTAPLAAGAQVLQSAREGWLLFYTSKRVRRGKVK